MGIKQGPCDVARETVLWHQPISAITGLINLVKSAFKTVLKTAGPWLRFFEFFGGNRIFAGMIFRKDP